MRALALALLRGYQVAVSPLIGPRCKFHPSCSSYAAAAVRELGPARGVALAAWRLLRCHPWSLGGVDRIGDRPFFKEPAP